MTKNIQHSQGVVWHKIGLGLLASVVAVHASPVSLSEAQNVAINWMQEHTGKTFQVKKPLGVSAQNNVTQPAYRIIQLDPKGWVIVSGDDVARPVIGYGESPINTADLPTTFSSWMHNVEKAISAAKTKQDTQKLGAGKTREFFESWQHFKQAPGTVSTEKSSKNLGVSVTVKPLLWKDGEGEGSGILWGQGAESVKYNVKVPVDNDGPNGHALTGCVATAMGQVMLYYKQPVVGTGSHSYTISQPDYQHNYGSQYADFSIAYDWDNMPDKLTATSTAAQVEAVATLLYHAGVSVEMDYGNGNGRTDYGSFAAYHDPYGSAAADTALRNYFGFTVKWHARSEEYRNNSTAWKMLLNKSLNDANPILFGGIGNNGGHAFVLDGYASNGAYHVNWGFDGFANGWYFIDHLAPKDTGYDFSQYQQVILFNEVGGDNVNHNKSGSGGGCTYNPHNKGIDLMLVLMIVLAGLYPLRRKYFQQA